MRMVETSQYHWPDKAVKDCAQTLQNIYSLLERIVRLQVSFWGTPTHADIIEFSNFLLRPKNQRSGSKTVCGFSIVLILKGIMTSKCHALC